MLSRNQRLTTGDFNEVMEKGRVVHSSLFYLRSLKTDNKTGNEVKIAAVVPQKVEKTAVGRNRLRRRMYEAVRKFYSRLQGASKNVVIAKSQAKTADFKALATDLSVVFVKAGLLK